MVATDDGIVTLVNSLFMNAFFPILVREEGDSKVTLVKLLLANAYLLIAVTDDGIMTLVN